MKRANALRAAAANERKHLAHRRARDQCIVSARNDGATLAEIADAVGLSIEGIRKVLHKQEVT